jgi:hypothetical protein
MTAAEYRATPKKPSKYRAKRTVVDGIAFHSKGEAFRWMELKLLERTGQLAKVERQVPYALHASPSQPGHIAAITIGKYVADFRYAARVGDMWTVEDFKGYDTPLSKWKRKHAEAEYGIKILLTGPAAKRRRK